MKWTRVISQEPGKIPQKCSGSQHWWLLYRAPKWKQVPYSILHRVKWLPDCTYTTLRQKPTVKSIVLCSYHISSIRLARLLFYITWVAAQRTYECQCTSRSVWESSSQSGTAYDRSAVEARVLHALHVANKRTRCSWLRLLSWKCCIFWCSGPMYCVQYNNRSTKYGPVRIPIHSKRYGVLYMYISSKPTSCSTTWCVSWVASPVIFVEIWQ